MQNIKRDVNESILLMNDLSYLPTYNRQNKYDKIMAFGGDNFKGVCDTLNISGDKALIVNGAGDQPLECVYRGFLNVDTFDINLLSRHMLNLKIASILALDYNEFVLFSKMLFQNEDLYQKVVPFLASDTKKYFTKLFSLKSRDLIYNNLFTHKYTHLDALIWDYSKQNFSFYNEKEFYELKKKLAAKNLDISFQYMDLFSPKKFSQKYDLIYFSNVLFFQNIDNIKLFLKDIFSKYLDALNQNGFLIFLYMHYFSFSKKDWYTYYDFQYQKIYRELKEVSEIIRSIPFAGFGHGSGSEDVILALQKK